MLKKIKAALPFAICLIILSSILFAFRAKLGRLEAEKETCAIKAQVQNAAIIQWQHDAMLAQAKQKEAEASAANRLQEDIKKGSAILAESVPTKCEEAVAWGASKAAGLSE